MEYVNKIKTFYCYSILFKRLHQVYFLIQGLYDYAGQLQNMRTSTCARLTMLHLLATHLILPAMPRDQYC